MSAGKGDKWRKDFDYSKYWTNFESISGEPILKAKEVKRKNGKVTYKFKFK